MDDYREVAMLCVYTLFVQSLPAPHPYFRHHLLPLISSFLLLAQTFQVPIATSLFSYHLHSVRLYCNLNLFTK